jgi:RNA polymerase sigma factor (sigma-70 family)
MNDDAQLLSEYAINRSETAFAKFVERHLSLVYHAALRRTGGRTDLAQDITQAVFATVAGHANALSQHSTIIGWLHTTVRFSANVTLRAERRRLRREEEAFAMQRQIASQPTIEWEYLRPVLDDVLDRLPVLDRDAILLHFFNGQSFASVGSSLRLTEEAARKRVGRAIVRMRALLAKRGITSTVIALEIVLSRQAGLAVPAGLADAVTKTALARLRPRPQGLR